MVKLPAIKIRIVVNIIIVFGTLAIIYLTFRTSPSNGETHLIKPDNILSYLLLQKPTINDYNIWLIFTKVTEHSPLTYKFHNLLENILNTSSIPLKFHIIIDNSSKQLATNEISDVVSHSGKPILYNFYDIERCAKAISDIVQVMTPYFSSKPGTYYSDALFYISLGLHRIAPLTQHRAILLDCDLYFKRDIKVLFDEFDKFKKTALFGLAPELTPVYRHILQRYKSAHNSTFGDYYHPSKLIPTTFSHPLGFQGYNSGVVLLNLAAIRNSVEYSKIIRNETVSALTKKYSFRGHLGDQDFYTLTGYEYPDLIQTLNCGFNRQLCVWWRDHGYRDVFYHYFKCREAAPVVLHGNCNTRIPT